ncbi:MAG: dephospho-CoA kinase [Lentisphaerae bacterium]|nr:dephospho-CoA kinase [Lentisphaerota bacterium]
MVKIAITGGIACGKTLVGKIFRKKGIPVCEADELGHELLRPDSAVFGEIVEAFGPGIVDEDGSISRKLLGNQVFADAGKLAQLNRITHPKIKSAWRAWQQKHAQENSAVIVPLFFETGEKEGWDCAICVVCDESSQLTRLLERGLTELDAKRRVAALMPVDRKIAASDYVIVNNGTMDLLEQQTTRVLQSILER